jgi:hypothetical protein
MDADESASGRRPASNPIEAAVANALNWRSSNLVLAGGEIGMWMCLAFGLEVAGVQVSVLLVGSQVIYIAGKALLAAG